MDERQGMVRYLREQLCGPVGGHAETLNDPPDQRYSVGMLYPMQSFQGGVAGEQIEDDAGGAFGDVVPDDPIALANQWMPSSIGLSFYVVDTERISCSVTGAQYVETRDGRRRSWSRQPLVAEGKSERVILGWGPSGSREVLVLDGRAVVRATVRPLGPGALVSVTMCNTAVASTDGRPDPAACLYQVGLSCEAIDGRIAEYPRVEFLTADDEEEELFLAYRSRRVYAIGHGCAGAWEEAYDGTAVAVSTDTVPMREVPGLAPGGSPDLDVLQLTLLADPASTTAQRGSGLERLVDGYSAWISDLEARRDYPPALGAARDRVIGRLHRAEARMREGIALLSSDHLASEAFRLANMAMLVQMHHSRVVSPTALPLGSGRLEPVDYLGLGGDYRWHPFQLAFMLLVLPSLRLRESDDRDLVDLLWFPTGGGKTEAYLLAAAFTIFLRRLEAGGRGAGTAVITRYTLRLLTTQQFQRASSLACACEWLRRADADRLGTAPIGIGLWVGSDTSPNSYADAVQWLDDVLDGASDDTLPVDHCPWCGTELIPEGRVDDPAHIGVEATNSDFRVFCPDARCPFHDRLPIAFVDEAMYEHPPTFLVGTVDKFARLAWAQGGGAFFGHGRYAPPDLIIQDEMHLISGPLGTTVGLYEAAIGGLLEMGGARPKVIASTATIRRAGDQALGIFGRRVALFPPSGIDEDDSYFSRTATDRPGRLYVGVLSANHTPSSSLIHVAAALAQAPVDLSLSGGWLDAMWTQVIYHNSLRELGKVVTFARDDIPARIEAISVDESRRRRIRDDEVEELTSNIRSGQIPAVLTRMNTTQDQPDAISILLATNMIQVGIDVPRLGLMLVNGQPKTTAEYIQATSRVGRGRSPGLVVALYSSSKPRDRSHYEAFHAFHQSLYRQVEPTSVTPFSLPSRERALHAALVILVRHAAGLGANDDAGRFDPADPRVAEAVRLLAARAAVVDPLEEEATRAHVARLVDEWAERARASRADGSRLYYYAPGREHRRLLRKYGTTGDGWETLDSMRSVDRQCAVQVVGGLTGA